MKESFFFEKDGIKLHYTKSGSGEKCVCVFHGSGQTENVFDQIRVCFDEKYTVYCFDLFFHGQSSWLEIESFTAKDWVSFFCDFLLENEINYFSILTFSLGTRFGLSLYEKIAERIEKSWIIAPEGLKIHWVYSLATGTIFTRFLLRCIIINPQYLLAFMFLLTKVNLIPKRGYQFLEKLMKSREKRLQFYKTWIVFRKLIFNTNKVINLMNAQNHDITIIASKNDYIVPFVDVQCFFKKLQHKKVQTCKVDHFKLIHELSKNAKSIFFER